MNLNANNDETQSKNGKKTISNQLSVWMARDPNLLQKCNLRMFEQV